LHKSYFPLESEPDGPIFLYSFFVDLLVISDLLITIVHFWCAILLQKSNLILLFWFKSWKNR